MVVNSDIKKAYDHWIESSDQDFHDLSRLASMA